MESPSGESAHGGAGGVEQAVPVLVAPVRLEAERTRIEAVGTGRAVRSVTLYPADAGEVVALHFAPGQLVAQGELLLELDHRSEELALELAGVQLKDAQQLLRRYEKTGAGAVPASTVDEARTAAEAAAIELRRARVALADRMVRAPFDGHVGLTDIDIGDRIGPDDAITTLDDRSRLLVSFEVPELFLDRVEAGQPVRIATWAERDRPIEGRLVEVGSRIDESSRSFTVRAAVPNTEDRLRPGMSFAITLDLFGRRYPVVPEVAVQWSGDGAYLWVVRDNTAHRIQVRIVQRREGTAMVEAGLEAGEPVVVEGIQRMRDGLEVAPEPEEGSS
jgi:RND family efflux transporter MFP subunit